MLTLYASIGREAAIVGYLSSDFRNRMALEPEDP
jgi:hypothetical protein